MKIVLCSVVALLVGGAIGGVLTYRYAEDRSRELLFVDAAADAKVYLQALEHKDSNGKDAYLESNLLYARGFLSGCEDDFCAEEEYPEVHDVLEKIRGYEFVHFSP